ncbi:DUF2188 domain-containing protein [Patulibacter sp. NPDC049589]|uniref:DUF2188 domain-containing protein n=1 Tax=Patulibacter sp. NPDC049589 TaxID=3154731 RepID=UPI0034490672
MARFRPAMRGGSSISRTYELFKGVKGMGTGNDNDRYVQRRGDGSWEVVREDHQRASAITRTQAEAIDRGREIVGGAGGGELRIKGVDGQIRDSDTIKPGRESPRRDTR